MKIHVFLDNDRNVVSITPAPVLSNSSKSKTEGGEIIFGGSEPAQKDSSLKCYELDSEVDLRVDLNQFEVSQLHERAIDLITSRSDLRLIELS
jgi:hypothetical protein